MLLKIKKYLILAICLFINFQTLSFAHELDKNAVLRAHIHQRKQFDLCMEKAPKNVKAEKFCRKSYARSRLFNAQKIFHIHMEHPLEAEELYNGALIGFQGKIFSLGETALGAKEAVFALDALGLTGVRVEFSPTSMEQFNALQVGDEIKVVAICKGMFLEGFVRLVNGEFF